MLRPLLSLPALVLGVALAPPSTPDDVPSDVPAPAVGAHTVGPLPDALLDDEEECSSSGSGIKGACDVPTATPSLDAEETAKPTGRFYCSHSYVNRHYELFGSLPCYSDNPYRSGSIGDFVTPDLSDGDTVPVAWRNGGKLVGEYAALVGLPDGLSSSLLSLYDEIEQPNVSSNPAADEDNGRFISTTNDQLWWHAETSGCVQHISPGDEATHDAFLERLSIGHLDNTLRSIAKTYELETLTAYEVSFARSANCSSLEDLEVQPETGGYAYKLVIPLSLRMTASMVIIDDGKDPDWHLSRGTYSYQSSVGICIGDNVQHSIFDVDPTGLVAIVHLAEIDEVNAPMIGGMVGSAFPLHVDWLESQIGRHYDIKNEKATMSQGRRRFHLADGDDCPDESTVEEQCRDIQMRVDCPVLCNVYVSTQTANDQIELFFASLPIDDECIDESNECSDFASSGMCMTDMEEMIEYGCNWSCLYCQVPSSAELFSLGVDQVFEYDDEEGLVTRVPSHQEILERIDQTVTHMIGTVLVQDDHKAYRISCRNYQPQCSYWAASGWCETYAGWMSQHCPAACFTCPLADHTKRCPVDKETNVIQPGEMNFMYERWLSEAGVDISTLSLDNPPPTSVDHPFGKLTVVSSPYYDMTRLLDDDEDEDDQPPLPWVITIEDFLTGEECDVLIKHGSELGYEQSTQYSNTADVGGSHEFIESESRTSTNTFCQGDCDADPIVRGVIDRIVEMSGITANHYEKLQLVRYEVGQYYKEHHDYASAHEELPFGPRILTFFLYLNDDYEGGGTSFNYLSFTSNPKRGMLLAWSNMQSDLQSMDDWTWHEALTVTKGLKYGANAWVHLRDYSSVPDYCSN